jgi:hypothetical protein
LGYNPPNGEKRGGEREGEEEWRKGLGELVTKGKEGALRLEMGGSWRGLGGGL